MKFVLTALSLCIVFASIVPDEAKAGLVQRIESAVARGERTVVVEKGDYALDLPEGRDAYFRFAGVCDLTIDFSGSRLWGKVKSRMFDLSGCTNVTIRNVTVDYPFSLPYTQARIVSVDAARNWDVEILNGYPVPEAAQIAPGARVWPVQVYSRDGTKLVNPMRFRDGIRIERLSGTRYRVSGGLDRRGEVGDVAVWSLEESVRKTSNCAFHLNACKGCLLEDCTVYATPMGCGFAEAAAERNTYRRCVLTRCPPEADPVEREGLRLRSGNHDAFNSRRSCVGPVIEQCRFGYHCDDDVNISGYFGIVTKQEGRFLRVCPFGGLVPCAAGDTCQVMTDSGDCPPDVTAVSCQSDGIPTEDEKRFFREYDFYPGIVATISKAYRIEIDRDLDLPKGSVIISNRRQGNGFVIRDSAFGPNRARGLLLKASDGLVENNTIVGIEGHPIMVATEVQWLEGGCSSGLTIVGNRMKDNGGGILISGNNMADKPLPFGAHRAITVERNVVDSPGPALKAVGCSGLELKGNRFTSERGETLELVNCKERE